MAAKSVEVGKYDLVLDPTNLWLTSWSCESVGHPSELDRVLGYEVKFAGNQFPYPADKWQSGKFNFRGSKEVNIRWPINYNRARWERLDGMMKASVQEGKWNIIKDEDPGKITRPSGTRRTSLD